MAAASWQSLLAELDRWHAAGKTARFWLRDDDVVEPTEALARLLSLSNSFQVPLTLAAIPSDTGPVLADHLRAMPLVTVAVHGWSHVNYAGVGEKKQELGNHRPTEIVVAELKAGFNRLHSLHADRFTPVLVPPWNRIAPTVIAELPAMGFEALSVFGPEKASALPQINTQVDLMDWHGTRGGRDHEALVGDILVRLRQTFETGGAMGLLTHHLVHDGQAWDFIALLMECTKGHPAAAWTGLPDLLRDR